MRVVFAALALLRAMSSTSTGLEDPQEGAPEESVQTEQAGAPRGVCIPASVLHKAILWELHNTPEQCVKQIRTAVFTEALDQLTLQPGARLPTAAYSATQPVPPPTLTGRSRPRRIADLYHPSSARGRSAQVIQERIDALQGLTIGELEAGRRKISPPRVQRTARRDAGSLVVDRRGLAAQQAEVVRARTARARVQRERIAAQRQEHMEKGSYRRVAERRARELLEQKFQQESEWCALVAGAAVAAQCIEKLELFRWMKHLSTTQIFKVILAQSVWRARQAYRKAQHRRNMLGVIQRTLRGWVVRMRLKWKRGYTNTLLLFLRDTSARLQVQTNACTLVDTRVTRACCR